MVVEKKQRLLGALPGVDDVLGWEEISPWVAQHPRPLVVEAIRSAIDSLRQRILAARGEDDMVDPETLPNSIEGAIQEYLIKATSPRLRPVINATGVVLHTNLGRAVLAPAAREQVDRLGQGYCNLELDLETGERGSRYSHVEELLTRISGAQAALVVNNNAAAVLLALNTLAAGREVIVSRGQLVEIGGSFRIPEVMEWSGCRLVEVGATNKTHPGDYERALGPESALLLKVHTSNYSIIGFTATVAGAQLVELGRKHGLPVMEDLGSGILLDLTPYGLPTEPTVQESVRAGIDVITFSGDKLLGGPQAGIILGKEGYIRAMKENPLNRALRIDKITLGALEATLRLYLCPEDLVEQLPVLQMLTVSAKILERRARALAQRIKETVDAKLKVEMAQDYSQVGGGAMPLAQLPTYVVALQSPVLSVSSLAARLRRGNPAVLARVAAERVLLDVRTILEGEEGEICIALAQALGHGG